MIYLDNSATTKQYDEVTELMVKCMQQDFGNPSALYQLGVDSEKILKNARRQIAAAAGRDKWDVVFTSGGTEADNMAVYGTARALKRAGRRIVTTAVEHPAVLECCRRLEEEGFEIIRVGVDRNCRLNMQQLEAAINSETILVTMMHVNNEAGTIMPVSKVREIMKKKGAPGIFHCDAVQSFGKLSIPFQADLISLSGHKIHGPKGSGALLINRESSPCGKNVHIPPYITGGGQESGKRSGTENVPAIAGLGLAAEMSMKRRPDERLRNELMKGLRESVDDIIINSPEETGEEAGKCCPSILNVSFMGTRGEVLLHNLEQHGIYVSTGSACSSNKKGKSHVLKAMGLSDRETEGAIRFSIGCMNTEEDIDFAVEKVSEAVKRFRRLGSFR